MTDDELIQRELTSVYGGEIWNFGPRGLGRHLHDGTMRPDSFQPLFGYTDPSRPELPSLGMYITVRMTYLLLMDGLAPWAQKMAANMTENLQVRDWLREALYPVKHYTHDEAFATMADSPQVRRVLIAGTLKQFGLVACRGWVDQAGILNREDRNVVAEMILQHLQEAPVGEIRAFLGAVDGYDHTELVSVLGDFRLACADAARVRAPQLFMYHGHKLGLNDEQLTVLCQWAVGAKQHFTIQQKCELVGAPWLPENVRNFLYYDLWKDDFDHSLDAQRLAP